MKNKFAISSLVVSVALFLLIFESVPFTKFIKSITNINSDASSKFIYYPLVFILFVSAVCLAVASLVKKGGGVEVKSGKVFAVLSIIIISFIIFCIVFMALAVSGLL